MDIDRNSVELGQLIAALLTDPKIISVLTEATHRANSILLNDSNKLAGIISIPLEIFGENLPTTLRSCRLSVMRAGSSYHIERHPNAIQYVYSLENTGSIRIFDGKHWSTTKLISDRSQPIQARWHMVPMNTWHQPIPDDKNWTVLAFHTVTANELIDDCQFESHHG